MPLPTRLFDLPDHQLAHYAKADMLAYKVSGNWKAYSTETVIEQSEMLAAGLLRKGIGGGDLTPESQDKIAIIANNRPEWIITDQACQQIGAVLTPIYPTISILEMEFVLRDAEAKIVFVSDESLYQAVHALQDKIETLKDIYTFDQVAGAPHWSELLVTPLAEEKKSIQRWKDSILPEHLATIIYTSGTTGVPKGAMLSHHNIISNVMACKAYLPVDEKTRALSFLPLNHVYERMITYLYIYAGVSIYYAESMETIGDNLKEVKPFIFTTVPRLLEKVYEKIMAKGTALKGIKRGLFFWAVALGSRFEINTKQRAWYSLQLAVARKLVFSKWEEALGGNIKAIVTGSAPCQVRLLRLFTAAGVNILEGYGLTETSPVISVNRMKMEDRKFGTVGPVIEGVAVTIAEDGEILCKGPNVMQGYYKRADLTAEAMTAEWFHTGDIGEMVDGKFLKITDRKKELFKTSGGKYVAPQPIENKMKESRYIEQIMVVGAGRKYTAALIVPNFKYVEAWCKKNNIPFTSREDMVGKKEIIELIRGSVDKYNPLFNHVEQIKKFLLLPHEWTIDSGELTPTLKLKRKIILDKYQDVIDRLYG